MEQWARPTIGEALAGAARRLADAGLETPRLDAGVLLRSVLGLDRTGLFLRLPAPLPEADARRFAGLVEARAGGAPVAYLTGVREFMGLPFAVRPGVLVPRPETEGLVEWALAGRERWDGGLVLDVGTGSGAIALSLAALAPPPRRGLIVAADRSAAALTVAAENADRLGVAERVGFVLGDLGTWCRGGVDLLLANLPYLRPEQRAGNPALAAEPEIALVAGDDGLAAIRRLVADAPRLLAPGGGLGLELDPSQAGEVAAMVGAALPGAGVEVRRDLAGRERYVLAVARR